MQKTILFFGDSITDCGRNREDLGSLGLGHAFFVKLQLGTDFPNEYKFINKGINGNRVIDLYKRYKDDFVSHNPDYASIYIGVNDVWRGFLPVNDGLTNERYEEVYTSLLDEIKEACPNTKLMLIAPFILEGKETSNTEAEPDRFERFKKGVEEKAAIVKKLALKYNLPLIELQPVFDEACKLAPRSYWILDGIHPTFNGQELIKREWVKTFELLK